MTSIRSCCIRLPQKLYKILKRFSRKRNSSKWLVQRAQIILLLARGSTFSGIAHKLGINRKTVRLWSQRWQQGMEILQLSLDNASQKSLESRIKTLLTDAPRSGAPTQFSAEQLTHMIAIACENPQESDRPISHWSANEIADEAIKRHIVSQISERTVNRLLSQIDLKPHRSRYWLNANPDCPQMFQQEVMQVCQTYEQAPALVEKGIYVISVDEKTGIQALERTHPHPKRPNRDELNGENLSMSAMGPVV